jgi:hypothetical protein
MDAPSACGVTMTIDVVTSAPTVFLDPWAQPGDADAETRCPFNQSVCAIDTSAVQGNFTRPARGAAVLFTPCRPMRTGSHACCCRRTTPPRA